MSPSTPSSRLNPTSTPTSPAADPGAAHELELRLGPDAPSDAAGSVVRSMALHVGLPAERATRLRSVIEELVREAREREFVGAADADVVVRTARCGDVFRVSVTDLRLPLAPGLARTLPSRRLAALGFVDKLRVASHGADGNVAECELHLRDTEAEVLDDTEILPSDVATVDGSAASALVVRPMEPSDASGVARCVYRCYGYSYLDPTMYRPELLRRALKSGLLHSVVAVSPDGEVAGHIALSFDRADDLVPEGGRLVVDPRYRGHHLAERLGEARAVVARGLGVSGVWFECVTNHPYSQKEVLAGGGVETGLLIGATPTSLTMAALENQVEGRHSLLTMWTPMQGTGPQRVALPARHVELLTEISGRAGQERQIDPQIRPAEGATRLHTSSAPGIGLGHLRVDRIGADLKDRVADELDGLTAFDLAVVHLDLPITDPSAAWAVDVLEALGFFWGAWLPGFMPTGDAVRLQRVADRPVDVDHIVCATAEGERLRDLVVSEWHRIRRGAPTVAP